MCVRGGWGLLVDIVVVAVIKGAEDVCLLSASPAPPQPQPRPTSPLGRRQAAGGWAGAAVKAGGSDKVETATGAKCH